MTDLAGRRPLFVIRPGGGWRLPDLRELWAYRELLLIFAWRDLKVRYRQTVLGVIWVIGQPLLGMLIFTFVFHRVAKIETAPLPYSVFVLAGLLIWNFFSNTVQHAGNSLIGSSFLISKVYFPRLAVPLSTVAVQLVDLAVSGLLLAALMLWYRVAPGLSILLLPLAILLALVFALGIGLWIAALNVQYRDVRVVIPFVLQLAMYATPVVYPLERLPEKYRAIAVLNPLTGMVEAFRASLFGTPVAIQPIAVSAVVALLVLVSGIFYFRRMERLFADVL
ncbi:MAG TPA: ABC transporter permease [Thermoanaerobaculia bacterium]